MTTSSGGHDAATENGTVLLTKAGERFLSVLGIDLNAVASGRRPARLPGLERASASPWRARSGAARLFYASRLGQAGAEVAGCDLYEDGAARFDAMMPRA
jgi:hypothetical protein